jgi:hypothetical protein
MVRFSIITLLLLRIATPVFAQDDSVPRIADGIIGNIAVAVKVKTRTFGFVKKDLELGYFYQIDGAEMVDFTSCKTNQTRALNVSEISGTEERDCERGRGGGLLVMGTALWKFDQFKAGYVVKFSGANGISSQFVSCSSAPVSVVAAARTGAGSEHGIFAVSQGEASDFAEALGIDGVNILTKGSQPQKTDCIDAQEFLTVPLWANAATQNGGAIGVLSTPSAISELGSQFDE